MVLHVLPLLLVVMVQFLFQIIFVLVILVIILMVNIVLLVVAPPITLLEARLPLALKFRKVIMALVAPAQLELAIRNVIHHHLLVLIIVQTDQGLL